MSVHRVAEALRALASANDGQLTPELVLKAAKKATSPLHEYFTWDDAAAAHQHRLEEARALIRSVRIEVKTERYTLDAPEFIRNPAAKADQQSYTSLGRLRTDQDLAREAVVTEFARASAALQRARAVAAALGIEEEVDDVRGRVQSLSERVQQPARA